MEPNPCGDNAECTNSNGSYICACKIGFTGNGKSCEGMSQLSSEYASQLFYFSLPLLLFEMENVHPFVSHQISTSVLRIPVLVMKTPIASTTTVLTAVTVSKDSLEMEYFVQVG